LYRAALPPHETRSFRQASLADQVKRGQDRELAAMLAVYMTDCSRLMDIYEVPREFIVGVLCGLRSSAAPSSRSPILILIAALSHPDCRATA
jgi:hypothetical protein